MTEYWAVIVGVGEYQYFGELASAHNDAMGLYEQLAPIYGDDHIMLLVDNEATKDNIEDAISDWLDPLEDEDDVVLFYFSGHGCYGYDLAPIDETDGYDEYICPYDILPYSYANNIRDDELDNWLDDLESDNIVVILDSCFSGGFIDRAIGIESGLPPTDPRDGFTRDLSQSGRVILTGCAEDEYGWEDSALGHGVFTYYILEALDELELTDANGDNEISVEEVFNYAAPKVVECMEGYQYPQIDDGYAGDLGLFTTATVTFDTSPPVASVIIDETAYSAEEQPVSFTWPTGTVHTFQTLGLVTGESGIRYMFTSWSDGDTSTSRTITVSESETYTANYTAQFYLTVQSEWGGPQGEGWYDEDALATFSVSPLIDHGDGTGYAFTYWSGDSTETTPSASMTMDSPKTVTANWKLQ